VAIAAPRKHGKALSLDSEVLTPDGWRKVGDLEIGDEIMGGNGKPTKVTHLHPIYEMPLYELETRDGRKAVCNDEHIWVVQCPQNNGERPVKRNLKTLFKQYKKERLHKKSGNYYTEYKYFIPTCEPIKFEEKEFAIEPYTLGAWLGDGSSYNNGLTTADPEIFDYIPYNITKRNSKYNYGISGLHTKLRESELLKNKHIPAEYLFGSITQREALLQGLLDTDGNVQIDGKRAEFSTIRKQLKDDFVALVRSLGGTATEGERFTKCNNKLFHSFRVTCRFPMVLRGV
jgi:hypothetical protein